MLSKKITVTFHILVLTDILNPIKFLWSFVKAIFSENAVPNKKRNENGPPSKETPKNLPEFDHIQGSYGHFSKDTDS